ncbi:MULTISPECIES: ImmA/IrrE family metallo-endopeptidase [Rhizobium/Agrobacterium group]|uniref:ImmA/IrrE family metallo-endopeptidase n=1 Tax=Rhizobium/Agrobacterium group TaxID=227290 RepID=UPI0012E9449A|nr:MULTISPECIES: ImmA/IrrE family metallo-endopeptidase [Rhizobium/Agrobacterium group]MCF1474960.1 ImmA/IrrE family metallo-endopeptidase [Allorhizobium ampelinum]MVA73473.1 ImmA/IrrE family metallo-endopeptidase [Agrobacterium vitis]NSZ19592.1 ImmA/IrrE family metallo-endopeptidase [Agrobacterium vitis]QZO07181.1 ImmA/IrrE family metallo-endopeptidase [Agrobacterium vitis]UJL91086.1 ImmA/IrrE family metallo-endopeptidase [Agrobacterium vitis]
MSKVFSLKMARQAAEALLKEEELLSLPVDPFAIAASRDIVVEGKPEKVDGVSGMLLRHGNNFGIVYATHIRSQGFQRFSVAHELGHYFLPGHVDQVIQNGIHVSRGGFVTNDPYELEADHFAAGLLMPEQPFRKEINRREPGLAAIEAVADLCIASRTAAAIRYAEVGDAATAVIMSTAGVIDYCFMSEAMKSLPKLDWLRKGIRLPLGTVTAALASDPRRVAAGERVKDEVDVREWLGGATRETVKEESLSLGTYGKILTILTSTKIGQDLEPDEHDEEQELIESWTPRFKR